MNFPIPHPDPMPLPAPVWLLRTLLLLTFFLHVLFMNCLLGGTAVALVCMMRRKTSAFSARLAGDLGRLLPSVFAFTVTLGVAPLLFLQVMYGQLLYASSILIGVPWLAIIGMVVLAYYGVYFFSMNAPTGKTTMVLSVVVLLLASIAFIYSNNFTLMLAPERWLGLYHSNAGGWNLNWSEPSLLPRYLHFVLGALAVSGLGLAVMGLRKQAQDYRRWLVEQGSLLFTGATILNFGVGFWFLAKLPISTRLAFIGGDGFATALLGIGLLLPLAAIAHLIMAKANQSPKRQLLIGVSCGMLTVAAMVVMRDLLRNLSLAPHFSPNQLPVAPQWSIIVLFVLLFVAGLGTLYYMLRKVAIATTMQVAAARKLQ
ncbi:MAG: hypothetical protein ABSD98_17745 [Candidatus Korobacteraceae bacterium]|jgi:hypothetical protein